MYCKDCNKSIELYSVHFGYKLYQHVSEVDDKKCILNPRPKI